MIFMVNDGFWIELAGFINQLPGRIGAPKDFMKLVYDYKFHEAVWYIYRKS